MVAALSTLIERLDGGGSPDEQLDQDLRKYALAGRTDRPDHETPRVTARIDQATALPGYFGIGWERIMQNIGDIDKWTAAAESAQAGDEPPFCHRFLIAVLNATKEARS